MPAVTGPARQELGLRRWINLYASGDYLGRWLWSVPDSKQEMNPSVLYDASQRAPSENIRQIDVSLGTGAHTHYFDVNQRVVAMRIDALIGRQRQQYA